jgi:hypothetical protein
MLIPLVSASLLLEEPSGNAATLSERVIDAIDHHYLYANSGTWKLLCSTLLAEGSGNGSSIESDDA